MASNLSYASKTDLQNLLLINIDSSFNTQIDTWISAAERIVNNYMGFTTVSGLWNEEITDEISDARVDSDANLVINPRKRPINSVSQIEIVKGTSSIDLDLTDSDDNTRYIIPATNDKIIFPSFELSTSSSTVLLSSFIDIRHSKFFTKIDYIAGYTSIPEDITLATTYFLADTFMRQANKEGLVAITQGRVTKRWAETKDGESNYIKNGKALLNHYRIASGWL